MSIILHYVEGDNKLKEFVDIINDKNKCSIKMLQALEGDCIFLQFTYEDKVFNMLIDSGPIACWNASLKCFLDELIEEHKKIDILVLTHIDSDHIGGALKLFKEDRYYSLIKNIWYNGLGQIMNISELKPDIKDEKVYRKVIEGHIPLNDCIEEQISAKQSESLSKLIDEAQVPINSICAGKAVCDVISRLKITDDFYIDVLLPSMNRLSDLLQVFKKELNMINMGVKLSVTDDSKTAFEYTLLDEMDNTVISEPINSNSLNLQDIEEWSLSTSTEDRSITNASSIALCISFYGKKYLFPGDAVEEDLIDALATWSYSNNQVLVFNVIKMPHHGSNKNCMNLLDIIDGEYYLISTDGKKFDHPSKEAIAKIVTRPSKTKRTLFFNYDNAMYNLFSDSLSQEKYNYQVDLLF